MIQLFKDKEKTEKLIEPKKRRSLLIQSNIVVKASKKKSREDNLRHQIYIDLDKSLVENDEITDKSFLSLSDGAVRRGSKIYFKGGFSIAVFSLNKILAKANSTMKPEYKGMKKRAIKRLQRDSPLMRQTSIALQKYSHIPKLLICNSYRSFGISLVTQTRSRTSETQYADFISTLSSTRRPLQAGGCTPATGCL